MKNMALKVLIDQASNAIESEMSGETDENRLSALRNAKEHLWAAWLEIHGDNDWRKLATDQLREHAKGVSHEQ